ncbi:MAG: hypothetical protein OXN92_12830 [Gammaproteobacteria bacterium]|nr:hypothetical protein [Gammaproteobacteria bacterium]
MGNWHEAPLQVDPKTGESRDSRDDNSPEACRQRLRSIEAAKRWRAGDVENAMRLLGGKDPRP